jgi:hypothetical protein
VGLALEVVFRTVIPASEFPLVKFDPEHRILLFENRVATEGTFTLGKRAEIRGRWRINNYGWNSPVDYDPQKTQPRLVVIGDSFVEAFQVDNDKSFISLLRESLSDSMEVYSFGISGSQLSQYLQMYRYAAKVFDPDVVVITVVHNDFDESIFNLKPDKSIYLTLDIKDGAVTERPPDAYVPSRIKRLLRHSALVRYLSQNLKIGLTNTVVRHKNDQYAANVEVRSLQQNAEMIRKATSYILERFRDESDGRRIIFLMDAPRQDIYDNRLDKSEVLFLNRMFQELCVEYGFELLDLTDSMSHAYAANGKVFNPDTDGHWNEYGHGFVADQVLRLFRR